MSFAAAISILACLCLIVGLLAAHWRFARKTSDLAALPLLCGGALGMLLAVDGDDGWPGIPAPQLRVTLAPLLIGVAGACSIRLRQLLWGIPAALTIDAGPSNSALHAPIESRSISFHDAAMDAERIPLTASSIRCCHFRTLRSSKPAEQVGRLDAY